MTAKPERPPEGARKQTMSRQLRYSLATVITCLVLSLLIGLLGSRNNSLDGWMYDRALWARAKIFPDRNTDPRVIVIALDQESLDSPELRAVPRALLAPVWAKVLNGLGLAGVDAVAFDLLFAFSGGQFKAGYDRSFQQALHGHRDKVVLGRTAGSLPAKSILAALRFDPGALGMLELIPGRDGVIREFPLRFDEAGGEGLQSLAARALELSGLAHLPRSVIPAPRHHGEALQAFALVDLLRCIDTAPDALAEIFKGRLVFVGSVLANEDRRLGAGRYLAPPVKSLASVVEDCDLVTRGASKPSSHTVPGVFLHAAVAQAVISGDWVEPLEAWQLALMAAVLGGIGAGLGLCLAPWSAFILALGLAGAVWGGEVLAIEGGLWLPAMMPIAALFLSTVLAYLVRYLVEERRRRGIQHAFDRYLAPSVVDGLLDNPEGLRLDGSLRDVSIMFADLSGFTALSTRTEPRELVALTNHYLAIIADEVDASGGYVDKFIGDAVMAIWGAPHPGEDHALTAVRTAMSVRVKIAAAGQAAEARGEHSFGIKIGIHSGQAIVGNVGSARRYNYTAVGETVNIAARLEGLPGVYGCSLMVGPTTGEAVRDDVLLREIDAVAVKGRTEPLTIFEPIADLAAATTAQREMAANFAEALGHYRARNFQHAADLWLALGPNDGPAQIMAERSKAYISAPPANDWDGVFVMTGK